MSKQQSTDQSQQPSEEAGVDDFLARNVTMSNALPGGSSPYAGALVGQAEGSFEPATDEERLREGDLAAEPGARPRASAADKPDGRGVEPEV
ncbi:MAG TPA: hypothetical protein VNT28_01290 [Candidatus Limnocylindrales bacterium]|jgi:hypothetical protein|nr:hypothetical protein [Candidatus Limnocylindrales bacterium]